MVLLYKAAIGNRGIAVKGKAFGVRTLVLRCLSYACRGFAPSERVEKLSPTGD